MMKVLGFGPTFCILFFKSTDPMIFLLFFVPMNFFV